MTFEENYIHAESVSAIMRFVNDVAFFFDDRQKFIHFKSASRVGYSDLGSTVAEWKKFADCSARK